MWRGRGTLGLVASLVLWVSATTGARAQEAPEAAIIESSEAPAQCPGRAELERRVRALAGPHPGIDLRARIQIVAVDGELVAHVEIVRPTSSALRQLHGVDCAALAEALALVIAISIDPSAAMRATLPAPPPTEPAPSEPSEPPPSEPVDPSTPAPPDPPPAIEPAVAPPIEPTAPPTREEEAPRAAGPRLAFVAAGWFIGGAGMLPSPSYGAMLLAGVRIEGVEIALGGDVLAESRTQISGTTRGGDFGQAAGRLRLGYAIDLSPFELVPTLAADVGATWGRGFGVARPGSGVTLAVDLAVGLEARLFFLEQLGVTLFVELTVPVLRPEFVLTGLGSTPVFRASEVGTLFGLGLVVRLR